MKKQFNKWMELKQKLHEKKEHLHFVTEGEIWWAGVGENVGFEINGKSKYFSRPVIILKKLSKNLFLVIPTTSQIRKGTWYVNFTSSLIVKTACLHHVRTIDNRRLYSRIGQLSKRDFQDLKHLFLELYK